MVYDAFALCFGAVIIPCLIKQISVAREYSQNRYINGLIELLSSPAIIGVRSSVAWASRIAERASNKDIATRRTAR